MALTACTCGSSSPAVCKMHACTAASPTLPNQSTPVHLCFAGDAGQARGHIGHVGGGGAAVAPPAGQLLHAFEVRGAQQQRPQVQPGELQLVSGGAGHGKGVGNDDRLLQQPGGERKGGRHTCPIAGSSDNCRCRVPSAMPTSTPASRANRKAAGTARHDAGITAALAALEDGHALCTQEGDAHSPVPVENRSLGDWLVLLNAAHRTNVTATATAVQCAGLTGRL